MTPLARKQQVTVNKLHKRLRRAVGQAIMDFDMISEGDRVMVCVSGGKADRALLDFAAIDPTLSCDDWLMTYSSRS